VAASRTAVLRRFGPGGPADGIRPLQVLVATDVAAEGLDLQRAGRVVHYDLPWTSVRLEQRDGRAIRAGSDHEAVAVIRFAVPAVLEARLAVEAAIDRKRALPTRIGLAADTARHFAVGERLRTRWPGPETTGWGTGSGAGAVAGFRLTDGAGRSGALSLGRIGSGNWSADRAVVERALELALVAPGPGPPQGGPAYEPADGIPMRVLQSLEGPLRRALAEVNGHAVFSNPVPPRLLAVVQTAAAHCRRERQPAALDGWNGALRFLGRSHTAGEIAVAGRITSGELPALPGADRPAEDSNLVTAMLVALIW